VESSAVGLRLLAAGGLATVNFDPPGLGLATVDFDPPETELY